MVSTYHADLHVFFEHGLIGLNGFVHLTVNLYFTQKARKTRKFFFEHRLNGFHGFIHLAVNRYFCPAEIKEMTEILT